MLGGEILDFGFEFGDQLVASLDACIGKGFSGRLPGFPGFLPHPCVLLGQPQVSVPAPAILRVPA